MDARLNDLDKRFQDAFQKLEALVNDKEHLAQADELKEIRDIRKEDLERIKTLRGEIADLLEGGRHEGS